MNTASDTELARDAPLPLDERLKLEFRPEELQSDSLRRLYADWFTLRNGDRIPEYSTFDICNFRYIVGSLNMMEVEHNPWRFRYRVHASRAALNAGKDMTGLYAEDYPSEAYRRDIQQFLVHAAQRHVPTIDITKNVPIFRRLMRFESVALPFGDADGRVTHLAVGISSSHPEQPN